jgi:hypothetical protein
VGAIAAGALQDPLDALLAPLGDDVGGAEVTAKIGAVVEGVENRSEVREFWRPGARGSR